MLTFLACAVVMVGVALAFLLMPLFVTPPRLRLGLSPETDLVALYRQQMGEVRADVDAGLLPQAQFEEAVGELEHRLLSELPQRPAYVRTQWARSSRTAIAVLLAVPIAAALMYWKLGNPGAFSADRPPAEVAHSGAHSTSADQIDAMVARLADKLASNPDNPEGWAMLARSYSVLGKHAQAVSAFASAAALLPGDADLLADYADALAMTLNGRIKGKPLQLVRRALKLDPDNPKALALAGSEAFDRQDYRSAAAFWQRALRSTPPGTEFSNSLRASLDEASELVAGGSSSLRSDHSAGVAAAMPESVSGRVVLAAALAAKAAPGDSIFVYAQAEDGPRMPLAILTAKVRDLPMDFVLDDSLAMSPQLKLSSVRRVVVTARISRSGSAIAQPGDLRGTSGPMSVGARKVQVEINEIVK